MIWPIFFVFMPILFVMVMWAIVMACRILFAEEADMLTADVKRMREVRARERQPVRVSAREIRADIRFRQQHEVVSYSYIDHASGGLPEAWWDDVTHRYN